MFDYIQKWLMNRNNIAPEHEYSGCQVPGCCNDAVESWMPSVCALREAGITVDWLHVCAEHDVELNETVVRLTFGDKYEKELAAYRASRIPDPMQTQADLGQENDNG